MLKTLTAALLALILPLPAEAQSRAFGQAQGWEVVAEFDGARLLGCGAAHPGGSGFMGLAQDAAGAWLLVAGFAGVQTAQRARLFLDGVALPDRPATGDGYTAHIPLTVEDRAALGAGRRLRVELSGGGHAEWALAGSAAAMAMVESCVARAGRAG